MRHSDRNLLFGIFALQFDFITREQLLAATQVWITDKGSLLADILERQGAIDSERRRLLDGLLNEQQSRPGSVELFSLLSDSNLSSLSDALRSLDDADLDGTLGRLDEGRRAAEVGETPGVQPGQAERFRVLRPHARGGLGEVSVALDTELNREVAFKEIQASHADNTDSRSRFLQEAEITGGLEHPGIVPVYGLGTFDDGRPFYAMRFIRGHSLRDAIQDFHAAPVFDESQRSLELRSLLRRFVDVCNAIDYAHSRGVLHRDLKPGNVMLGKYGETLVVDWGLAKAAGAVELGPGGPAIQLSSGSGATPTQVGQAIGTPAYMSPEQAAGDLTAVGPASDVYSLGATLYSILTGRAPVSGDSLPEVLERVRSGRIDPPESVARTEVPRPLQAVCLKALRQDRTARYQTCRELADDVDRWLADEPVSAWEEPLSVRVRRWVRSHQTLSVSVAVAVLMLSVGLGVVSFVVGRKNQVINAQYTELDRQHSELQIAKQAADDFADSAREQSELALGTMNTVIFDIAQELRQAPGMGPLRKQLLSTVIDRLPQVARELVDGPAVDRNTLVALIEMGDAVRLISDRGERGPAGVRFGIDQARELYQVAHDLASKLVSATPDDTDAQRDLWVTLERLGRTADHGGDTAAAEEFYVAALEIVRALQLRNPDDVQAQRDLADGLISFAGSCDKRGKSVEALDTRLEAERLRRAICATDEAGVEDSTALADVLASLGTTLLKNGQLEQAAGRAQEAMDIWNFLIGPLPAGEDGPDDIAAALESTPAAIEGLAEVSTLLGDVRTREGATPGAAEYYRKAHEIYAAIVRDDPLDVSNQRDLISAKRQLGLAMTRLQEGEEALTLFREAVVLAESAVQQDASSAVAREDLAAGLTRLSVALSKAGQATESLDFAERAHALWLELAETDVSSSFAARNLATSFLSRAGLFARLGRNTDAQQAYEESFRIFKEQAQRDDQNVELQRQLGSAMSDVAAGLASLGKTERALELTRESLAMRQRLAERHPADPVLLRDASLSSERIGHLLLRTGDLADSERHFQQMFEMKTRLVEMTGSDSARYELGIAHLHLGDIAAQQEQFDQATEHYRAFCDAAQQHLDKTGQPHALDGVLFGRSRLVDLAIQREEYEEAQAQLREIVSIREQLAEADPDSLQPQRDLAASLDALGLFLAENLQEEHESLAMLHRARELRERLRTQLPQNAVLLRDLSLSQEKLGTAYLQFGRQAEAADWFQRMLSAKRELAAIDVSDGRAQRDLAVALWNMGHVYSSENPAAAHPLFREAVTIFEKLAASARSSDSSQEDLAGICEAAARNHVALWDLQEAERLHRRALALRLQRAEALAASLPALRNVSSSYEWLGHLMLDSGRTREATEFFERMHDVKRRLLEATPDNGQARRDLSVSQSNLALLSHARGEYMTAARQADDAIAMVDQALADGLPFVGPQALRDLYAEKASEYRAMEVATGDWSTLENLPKDELNELLVLRATELGRRGRIAEAVRAAEELVKRQSQSPSALYDAACAYALCHQSLLRDPTTGQPPLTAEALEERAISTVLQALEAGFDDLLALHADTDLISLRGNRRFADLFPDELKLPSDP